MDISNISSAKSSGATPPGSARARRSADPGESGPTAGRDRIELSSAARDLQRAEQAVQQSSDLRFDVVSRLRTEVRGGTYYVDATAVARAMVEKGERAE